jgi:DNA-binding NtrC family response regulator
VIEAEAHGLLGDAPVMHDLRRTLSLVALSDATALVTGESGTGKELIARAIHRASRPNGPFIAVNCGAIAESVAESQLFGHVSGAFTGAKEDHPGFFRAANGGVLFLDEVGELPPAMQTKLLRALEERAVIPVGAVKSVPFDVRVVAATNRELPREIEDGRFRRDLYARLADITLRAPPLRDRAEDVLRLTLHALGPDLPPLTADLAEALLLHDWPYNVRELMKVAAELKIRGRDVKALELSLVAERLQPRAQSERASKRGSTTSAAAAPVSGEEKEKPIPTAEELVTLLRQHGGSIAEVARATGRSRKQVYRWLDTHGIDVVSFRSSDR